MLSPYDRTRLINIGFSEWEVDQYDAGTDPSGVPQPDIDLDSPLWQSVMLIRETWLSEMKDQGYSEYEIETMIMEYYLRNRERSPWDFLKAEYKSKKKVDFSPASSRSAQARIEEFYRM